jgi:hypothetical protein
LPALCFEIGERFATKNCKNCIDVGALLLNVLILEKQPLYVQVDSKELLKKHHRFSLVRDKGTNPTLPTSMSSDLEIVPIEERDRLSEREVQVELRVKNDKK